MGRIIKEMRNNYEILQFYMIPAKKFPIKYRITINTTILKISSFLKPKIGVRTIKTSFPYRHF